MKSHVVWQAQVAEIFKGRSPMDPENPTLLVLSPHPIARHMVQWLRKNKLLLVSQTIENKYKEVIENERLARIQRLRDKKAEREQEKIKVIQQKEKEINDAVDKILEPINQVRARINEDAKVINDRLNKLVLNDKKIVQVEKDQIQKLKGEIKSIDDKNIQLEKKVKAVQGNISVAEKENAKLQQAINETRKAIKKQRQGWVKGVLKTAAVVAACAVATWGVGAIAGGGVAIAPMNGGAKMIVALPI
jgi:hypothetical protein